MYTHTHSHHHTVTMCMCSLSHCAGIAGADTTEVTADVLRTDAIPGSLLEPQLLPRVRNHLS